METLHIRIERIVDFGLVVSLVGVDLADQQPVTVHIDHRPFAAFYAARQRGKSPAPIEYAAQALTLQFTLVPDHRRAAHDG